MATPRVDHPKITTQPNGLAAPASERPESPFYEPREGDRISDAPEWAGQAVFRGSNAILGGIFGAVAGGVVTNGRTVGIGIGAVACAALGATVFSDMLNG